jgi:hypothetical protein
MEVDRRLEQKDCRAQELETSLGNITIPPSEQQKRIKADRSLKSWNRHWWSGSSGRSSA